MKPPEQKLTSTVATGFVRTWWISIRCRQGINLISRRRCRQCTASRKRRTRSNMQSGHKVPPLGGNGKQTGGSPTLRTHHKDGVTTDDTGKLVFWWFSTDLWEKSQRTEEFGFFFREIGNSWGQSTVTDGGCKGSKPCTSYSRTFTIHNYGYGIAYNFTHNKIMLEHTAMNDKNTIAHTDAHNTQFWAHCAPPVDAQCFTSHFVAQDCLVCVIHIIHAGALVVGVLSCLSSSLCPLFSTSSYRSSSSPSWCSPQRPTRGPCQTPCATPAWGAWSHPTTSHPSQVMSPRRTWTSRTLKSSTSLPPAISTSSTPWTTMLPSPTIPLRNSLQLWSIEQGNVLRWEAIMINFLVTSETWKVLRVSFL